MTSPGDLQGATERGPMGTWPRDAGDFAARWNSRTLQEREALVESMVEWSTAAERCAMHDHDGELADLRSRLARVDGAS